MVWGAAAAGVRPMIALDRPGHQPHAGVVRRDHDRRAPARHRRTWRAARATTSRRRAAAATATTATWCWRRRHAGGGRPHAARLPPRRPWRNPVLVMGDFLLGHTSRGGRRSRRSTSGLPPKNWAVDGALAGAGAHASCRRSASRSTTPEPGHRRHLRRIADKLPRASTPPRRALETGFSTTPSRGGGVRQSGRSCGTRWRSCRAEGVRVGFVRPISLWPFPIAVRRRRRRRRADRRRLRAERRSDDRRRAARGARAARRSSASAASPRRLGLRRRPAARRGARPRAHPRGAPRRRRRGAAAPPRQREGVRMTTTPLGPVLDTSVAPTVPARRSATSSPSCSSPRSTTVPGLRRAAGAAHRSSRRSWSSTSRDRTIAVWASAATRLPHDHGRRRRAGAARARAVGGHRR